MSQCFACETGTKLCNEFVFEKQRLPYQRILIFESALHWAICHYSALSELILAIAATDSKMAGWHRGGPLTHLLNERYYCTASNHNFMKHVKVILEYIMAATPLCCGATWQTVIRAVRKTLYPVPLQ